MKRIFFILILISTHIYSDELIQEKYYSSDKTKIVMFKGAERDGNGEFYYYDHNKKITIFKGYLRYGPIIEWVNTSIIEIKVPTGSPNFHTYYFNFDSKQLSVSYNLAIAYTKNGKYVACLDMEKIIIYEIFTSKIVNQTDLKNLEPMSFLSMCKTDYDFLDNNTFVLKWKCPGQAKEKEITIKI